MKVQKSIEINAPPEKIWPYFIEPEKILAWCITFKKFEYTGPQHSGVGTPLYIEEQAGGSLSRMQFVIDEWKEYSRLVLRMISGGNYQSYIQQYSIQTLPVGCRVTFEEEIVLPYGVFGRLIGFFAEKMSAQTVDKMEIKLKGLAEA